MPLARQLQVSITALGLFVLGPGACTSDVSRSAARENVNKSRPLNIEIELSDRLRGQIEVSDLRTDEHNSSIVCVIKNVGKVKVGLLSATHIDAGGMNLIEKAVIGSTLEPGEAGRFNFVTGGHVSPDQVARIKLRHF